MAKIDSAYDYYVSTYGNQKTSRYDSHKKSDLRKVYNSIVKSNKESPLYKISDMDEAKRYAIDIKENAKAIQNTVSSLLDGEDGVSAAFQKKVAISSDENKVGVEYVGDGSENNTATQFEISVESLAAPQINKGNALRPEGLSITPGSYAFDLNTNTATYEFQFSVAEGETNGEVLSKLERLVNSSNLKIHADIDRDKNGRESLVLTSKQTGLRQTEASLFTITPDATPKSMQAMNVLGINQVYSPAQNSTFYLNGRLEHSLNNTFTINSTFELTLKDTNKDGEATLIGFKTNAEAVADNIQKLLDSYNGILSLAEKYTASGQASQGRRLFADMSSVAKSRKEELDSIGLAQDEKGYLSIDRDRLENAISAEQSPDTFKILSDFRDAIGRKAENISVNPMNYVDKVVVEYKNPGKNFATPYISSIYSGMMLDGKV